MSVYCRTLVYRPSMIINKHFMIEYDHGLWCMGRVHHKIINMVIDKDANVTLINIQCHFIEMARLRNQVINIVASFDHVSATIILDHYDSIRSFTMLPRDVILCKLIQRDNEYVTARDIHHGYGGRRISLSIFDYPIPNGMEIAVCPSSWLWKYDGWWHIN